MAMKIALCASMIFTEKMFEVKKELERMGHTVFVSQFAEKYIGKNELEKESLTNYHKNEKDAIREVHEKTKESDAILVLNYDRRGVNYRPMN